MAEQEAPSFTQISFRLSTMTHPGALPKNEDNVATLETPRGSVVVVADGAGGHAYGEVASELVVRHVTEFFKGLDHFRPDGAIVEAALQHAQEKLRAEITSSARYHDMRSTGVVVLATRDRAWVGHVGDSRAYLIRDGEIRQLTRDDSLVQSLIDIGQLDRESAKKHSKANVLLQSLGDPRELEYHVSDAVETKVGDVLVACTDGLTDVVTDAQIAEATRTGTSAEIAQRLIDLAVENKTHDNVSVSVISWRKSASGLSIAAAGRPKKKARKARGRDSFPIIALFAVSVAALGLAFAVRHKRRSVANDVRPHHVAPGIQPLVLPVTPPPESPSVPLIVDQPPVDTAQSAATDAAAPDVSVQIPAVAMTTDAAVEMAPDANVVDAALAAPPTPVPVPVPVPAPAGAASRGTLRLLGLPPGARVFIDREAVAVGPDGAVDVPAGRTVRVRIHKSGYRDQYESVRISVGESLRLRVSLSPRDAPTGEPATPPPVPEGTGTVPTVPTPPVTPTPRAAPTPSTEPAATPSE